MRIDELKTLAGWLSGGRRAALATVVATWGSAPRPVGSLLAIRDDGLFEGSVSGGCVEAAVITSALEAIGDGQARSLSFGVSNDDAFAVGLACGGTIRIHIEPFRGMTDDLSRMVSLRDDRQAFTRVIELGEPVSRLVQSQDATAGQSRLVAGESGEQFRHVFLPEFRLMIVGAVHIAQFLAAMGEMAEYDVTLIDPRPAYANRQRFGSARLIDEWPDAAFATSKPDHQTAIVTLSHDPKLDDPALACALRSDAFYIAALGSRRTQALRRERLVSAGFDEAALSRIHGPAGLAIGAASPAEIALSIMAQMTEIRRIPRAGTSNA